MGQSKPLRAMALIVEDDPMQRDMICLLLEESELDVIECESAEAAELVLERAAGSLVLMLTDVQLAGNMDGVELAHIARKYNPEMGVIVTSGSLRLGFRPGARSTVSPADVLTRLRGGASPLRPPRVPRRLRMGFTPR